MIATGLTLMALAGAVGYLFGRQDGRRELDDQLMQNYTIKRSR